MIDMHSHILPGIDDGAQSLDEALALARQASQDGTTLAFLTPHSWGTIPACLAKRQQSLRLFQDAWRHENSALQIRTGLECFLQDHIFDAVLQYPDCFYQSNNKQRLLLLELPWDYDFRLLANVLFQAQLREITLVLAHPERYVGFLRQAHILPDLLEKGLYLQFNASAFSGGIWSWRRRKIIIQLLRSAPTQMLLGSDAHDVNSRPALLSPARGPIVKALGETMWQQITASNPARLLGL